jgi:AcrR family transcriptional regulator
VYKIAGTIRRIVRHSARDPITMSRSLAVARSTPRPSVGPGEVPAEIVARLGPVVLRTFAVEDFHRVDMRSIAREAGMSFATIYRHFRDKEALLFWFIAHWLRDLYPAAIAALATDQSALVRLQNYLRVHLVFYQRNPEVGRIIFMTVPLERWMRDDTYRANEPVTRLLEVIAEGQASGEIRADVSRVVVFDAWSGIFNRAFLMWEYRNRAYSLTGQWTALCRILVGGIGPPGPPAAPAPVARRRRAPATVRGRPPRSRAA